MKTIPLLLLCGLVAGCVPISQPIDQKKLSLIKKGESTEADVLRLLGRPKFTSLNDGPMGQQKILTYSYVHTSQVFGMMMGVTDTRWQTASFTIGADGKVEAIASMIGATGGADESLPRPASTKGATR